MMRHLIAIFTISLAAVSGTPLPADDTVNLGIVVGPGYTGGTGGGCIIGSFPGYGDGWDGFFGSLEKPVEVGRLTGPAALSYRETGPTWAGPTGLYAYDYESPPPPGGSRTWTLYLWTSQYVPPGNVTDIWISPHYGPPPPGWMGQLVLDYVPPYLNWTGGTEFWVDLTASSAITLPVPLASDPLDPLQVTRLRMTIYAPPVPEPSSLLALAGGLALFRLRRRRR